MPGSTPAPDRCYWELTRRCALNCQHCRADAGPAGADELDLNQALETADQLAALGVKAVVLTGGEPTLYDGWEKIAARLAHSGVRVRLFISGWDFDHRTLQAARDAGVSQFSISLDGLQPIHDRIRPVTDNPGASSFAAALQALTIIRRAEMPIRVVTQVNRLNVDHLAAVYHLLAELKIARWQLQLCQMTGRARRHGEELMCEPRDLEQVLRILSVASQERKIRAPMHCTVGYMIDEEPRLRPHGRHDPLMWLGCVAARQTLAINAVGGVKGCTALPDEFVTASLKDRDLADLWNDDGCFPYARRWSADLLAGLCAACMDSKICRAGCPAVAYAATGSIGANPYCLKLVRQTPPDGVSD